MGVWNNLMNGLSGFRAGWLNADTLREQGQRGEFDAFNRWDARKFRYDLFWAFYQNNTFQAMSHAWSPSIKAQFGLYKNTRNIFCPGKRLGDFWGSYPYSGTFDAQAGDDGAAPILTDIPAVRPRIARLWRDSRWNIHSENWTRSGAIYGDSCLKLVDDPIRRRVTMKPVHPGHVKWFDKDHSGRVKSYIIEEQRYDPRRVPFQDINPILDPRALERIVTYNEECFIDGDEVVYRTFLNGGLFDWRKYSGDGTECAAEWRVPYGVVPLVIHPHQEIGLQCGMSEFHGFVSKVFEVDDMASGLGDQYRKTIRAPWVIFGAKPGDFKAPDYQHPPRNPMLPGYGQPDGGYPADQRGREQLNIQTISDPAGKAQSLVADLKGEDVGLHIDRINAEIERDYPELQMDIWATSDVSGRALREARRRVVTKVQGKRACYDLALADAHEIAMYIESVMGYEGAIKGVDQPEDPKIEHSIGPRAVFAPDPLDDLEEDAAFWDTANKAKVAGVPVRFFLADNGWDEAKLAKLDAAIAAEPKVVPAVKPAGDKTPIGATK